MQRDLGVPEPVDVQTTGPPARRTARGRPARPQQASRRRRHDRGQTEVRQGPINIACSCIINNND